MAGEPARAYRVLPSFFTYFAPHCLGAVDGRHPVLENGSLSTEAAGAIPAFRYVGKGIAMRFSRASVLLLIGVVLLLSGCDLIGPVDSGSPETDNGGGTPADSPTTSPIDARLLGLWEYSGSLTATLQLTEYRFDYTVVVHSGDRVFEGTVSTSDANEITFVVESITIAGQEQDMPQYYNLMIAAGDVPADFLINSEVSGDLTSENQYVVDQTGTTLTIHTLIDPDPQEPGSIEAEYLFNRVSGANGDGDGLDQGYFGDTLTLPSGFIENWEAGEFDGPVNATAYLLYSDSGSDGPRVWEPVDVVVDEDGYYPGVEIAGPDAPWLYNVGLMVEELGIDATDSDAGIQLIRFLSAGTQESWGEVDRLSPDGGMIAWFYVDRDVHLYGISVYDEDIDVALKAGWNQVVHTYDPDSELHVARIGAEPDGTRWVFTPAP